MVVEVIGIIIIGIVIGYLLFSDGDVREGEKAIAAYKKKRNIAEKKTLSMNQIEQALEEYKG